MMMAGGTRIVVVLSFIESLHFIQLFQQRKGKLAKSERKAKQIFKCMLMIYLQQEVKIILQLTQDSAGKALLPSRGSLH